MVLKDGTKVSKLGIGGWYIGDDIGAKDEEISSIRYAIDNGVNLIDTASMYGNGASERLIGEALQGYKREELFIVSKVLPSHASFANTIKSCEQSLKNLKTDYLDMYLLHWRGVYSFEETFSAFEELKHQGKIKNWGVSNMDIDDMKEILSTPQGQNCMVNQVLYHLGSRGIEFSLKPFMDKNGILTMAYCPLAQGGRLNKRLLSSNAIKQVAKKHDISIMQVLLCFVLMQTNTIAIPKSSKLKHTKENINCLNIKLDEEDLALLSSEFKAPTYKLLLDIQ